MKHNHSASMTKQFVSEARGSMTPSVRIVDLIKYAHAGHMIFIIIWWHLSQNKVICPPRKRKKQDCSIYVYQKVQNENHIMQSNESVNSRTITVTKPIKLLSAQQATVHAVFASFSITFNSLSLRTRPNSENNQLVLMFYLHSFSLRHSSPKFSRMSSKSILAAENAHLSISPLARTGK